MTIKDLDPKSVWGYFYDITQIPRPSKKEEKIIAYLLDFAKKFNLEAKQDKAGNVLITKQATTGKENVPTVILQSHIDMVCEKNNDVTHDFDNDPIETIIDGDWVKANGTTLGADNGMGIAAALAVLAANDIAHGKIEALFTVDEETGLTGANSLQPDFFTGSKLINLDTEEEGQIYIGCAGGKGTKAYFKYKMKDVPKNYFWFKVQVKGLRGGHSGSDIDRGFGNANKILNRFMFSLTRKKFGLVLSQIGGGNLHNAIAREAFAVMGVKDKYKEDVRVKLNHFLADVQNELKQTDPGVDISMESVQIPSNIINKKVTEKLILAIHACPHGVIGMSHEIDGLVETSTNLASVKMIDDNLIEIGTSQRSSIESCKDSIVNTVSSVFDLAGAKVTHNDGYPGWQPNTDSALLKLAQQEYENLFGKTPEVKAIHAGLECGLFLEKYPQLDMISIGPDMTDVHSPAEQVNIPSVDKWWKYLVRILEAIPAESTEAQKD
ncbi:MAG: aminoacyl-histidine dipeptidase [Dysgonamonadaceae bacterium]|jgi:dipeptidase D|nr:aminoacyl-histidine dipeptidase [Dysgonamonadaceae bacterium]